MHNLYFGLGSQLKNGVDSDTVSQDLKDERGRQGRGLVFFTFILYSPRPRLTRSVDVRPLPSREMYYAERPALGHECMDFVFSMTLTSVGSLYAAVLCASLVKGHSDHLRNCFTGVSSYWVQGYRGETPGSQGIKSGDILSPSMTVGRNKRNKARTTPANFIDQF